jgi:hypothetical protein
MQSGFVHEVEGKEKEVAPEPGVGVGVGVIDLWHYVALDGTSNQTDAFKLTEVGQEFKIPIRAGITLCGPGVKESAESALEALGYSDGPILVRLRLTGKRSNADGCFLPTHCRVLARADVTRLLREFAIWVAEQALLREREAGREPDARCWAAIEAARKHLAGEIDDLALDAAWAAAWDASRDAAGAAAGDAAGAAAWDASRAAAGAAAWTAAGAAAGAAARAAARDAAGAAARAAAWDGYKAEFEKRVIAFFQEQGVTI